MLALKIQALSFQPLAALVVKTKQVDSTTKVFVNVLWHADVPRLGAAFSRLGRVLLRGEQHSYAQASGDGQAYLLVVSEVRDTTDVRGERSLVVDVVVPAELCADLDEAKRAFVTAEAMAAVGAVHSLALDPSFKLPKIAGNYKGKDVLRVQTEEVQCRSEVEAEAATEAATAERTTAEDAARRRSSTNTTRSGSTFAPNPWFVVKSKMGDKTKIFVNICHNEAVPDWPHAVTDSVPVVHQQYAADNGLLVVSVAQAAHLVHCGQVRDTEDLQGQRSKVCDVVIGADLKAFSDASSANLDLFVVACLRAIAAQRGLAIDLDYKMPHMANGYKGALGNLSVTLTGTAPWLASATSPLASPDVQRRRASYMPASPGYADSLSSPAASNRRASATASPDERFRARTNSEDSLLSTSSALDPGAVTGDASQVLRLLQGTERMLYTSLVKKKNRFGLSQSRQLALTDRPSLFYVDPSTPNVRMEIDLSADCARLGRKEGTFEVHDVIDHKEKRVYNFSTSAAAAAADWVQHINGATFISNNSSAEG